MGADRKGWIDRGNYKCVILSDKGMNLISFLVYTHLLVTVLAAALLFRSFLSFVCFIIASLLIWCCVTNYTSEFVFRSQWFGPDFERTPTSLNISDGI